MGDVISSLTIKAKVRAVLGSLFAVLTVMALLAGLRLGDIADATANVRVTVLPTTRLLGKITDVFQRHRILEAEHVLAVDDAATATEDIAQQIGEIQKATDEAVVAIGHIGGTIGEISDISTVISAAVELQGATTEGIKQNTVEAASGTGNVSANISRVSVGAGETGAAAGEVLNAAGELGRQSENLRREITRFLDEIRAA